MRSVYRLLKPMLPVTLVLMGLWIAFIIAAPQTFLDKYIYISFMTSIPFIAIAAAGITLVVIAGEMDMSFASNMAMSGFAFAVITRWSGSPALGLAAALAMGACIGLINGLTITGTGAPSIVVTIGFDFFWRGSVMLLSNGLAVSLASMRTSPTVQCFTGRIGGLIPAQTVWMLGVSIFFAVILHRTVLGDGIRFIGDNKEAARMMGLPVRRTRIGVFDTGGRLFAAGDCLGLSGRYICVRRQRDAMGFSCRCYGDRYDRSRISKRRTLRFLDALCTRFSACQLGGVLCAGIRKKRKTIKAFFLDISRGSQLNEL